MIDVIIPAYNAHNTINKTLISIGLQTIKDNLKVYIVNDKSDIDYYKEVNLFKDKFNIKELKLEKNMGPGYARQFGMDNSNSEFIVFIDSDDVLYDCFSLENMLKVIRKENCDLVYSNMFEKNGNGMYCYSFRFDVLHGKIYRRSFIEKNNIYFPSFYNSEDLAFNNLLLMHKPKMAFCEDYSYIYIRGLKSLTTASDYYEHRHIKCCVEGYKWSIYVAEKRNLAKEEIGKIIINAFGYLYCYFCYNLQDYTIQYVYELIPLYNKYHIFVEEELKENIIYYWIDSFGIMPLNLSYEDFILMCNQNSKIGVV